MAIIILRTLFLLVAAGIAVLIFNSEPMRHAPVWMPWAVLAGMIAVPLVVIGVDLSLRRKDLIVITAIYFGLLIGVFVTYIGLLALTPFLPHESQHPIRQWLPPILGAVLCYICTSLLLQTRHDFRFLIPYVEFARDVKGLRPNVLDISAIVDGRIADLAETGLFQSRFVVPTFVVEALHEAADSADKSRRIRGRRGLDVLGRLQASKFVDLEVISGEREGATGESDESKLVEMTQRLGGRVITNDVNLAKAASVRAVAAININEVAFALKPVYVTGDVFEVRLVKPGEEPGQGVGYLDDGTMVVVEGGRERIGRTVRASVTSTLQTTAGRLVFARPEA